MTHETRRSSLNRFAVFPKSSLMNGMRSLMTEARFLSRVSRTLEETGCTGGESGWYPTILTCRADGQLLGALPLYVKTHSRGEFVFDWAWADAAQRAGIQYYPKATVAVPFTPVTGTRLLVHPT